MRYDPILHIVLHEPEIPPNAGNVGRSCVALGAKMWLVRPLGFKLDDYYLRRAGLDYWLDDAERAAASPAMIWAAKEAAYKAAGLDAVFRPLGVAVEPSDDGTFAWTLRDDWRMVSGTGRFFEVGCHLVAVACTHAASGCVDTARPAVHPHPTASSSQEQQS